MQENKQQILSYLHTFSVAARHLSFTLAANELALTQGGVSHRIKKLESQVGFKLFIRRTRQLDLTVEGQRLFSMINRSFEQIFAELDDIRHQELSGDLYIGTSPYFASAWLIPRLQLFKECYPHLSIKLQTKESRMDFQFDPVDLGIYYGSGHYPDHYSRRLFVCKRLPVCTRDYANQFKLDESIDNLSKVNFIHSGSFSSWQHWLDTMGVNIDCTAKRDLFSQTDLTVEAARHSMGVALGRLEFVQEYIDSGELVAPYQAVESGKGYDLVCPEGMQTGAKYQAFYNWVTKQL